MGPRATPGHKPTPDRPIELAAEVVIRVGCQVMMATWRRLLRWWGRRRVAPSDEELPLWGSSTLLVLHVIIRSTRVRTFVILLVHRPPTVRTLLQTATGSISNNALIGLPKQLLSMARSLRALLNEHVTAAAESTRQNNWCHQEVSNFLVSPTDSRPFFFF